jgi:hypothetical protein
MDGIVAPAIGWPVILIVNLLPICPSLLGLELLFFSTEAWFRR